MSYIFDNSSLSKLKHYYPNVFKSVWTGLDGLVATGDLISTREVWNEMQLGAPNPHVQAWLKANKHIFQVPQAAELQGVAKILAIPHFQALIGRKQQLFARSGPTLGHRPRAVRRWPPEACREGFSSPGIPWLPPAESGRSNRDPRER